MVFHADLSVVSSCYWRGNVDELTNGAFAEVWVVGTNEWHSGFCLDALCASYFGDVTFSNAACTAAVRTVRSYEGSESNIWHISFGVSGVTNCECKSDCLGLAQTNGVLTILGTGGGCMDGAHSEYFSGAFTNAVGECVWNWGNSDALHWTGVVVRIPTNGQFWVNVYSPYTCAGGVNGGWTNVTSGSTNGFSSSGLICSNGHLFGTVRFSRQNDSATAILVLDY